MKNEINILGVKITTGSKEYILEKIEKYVKSSKLKTQNSKLLDQKALIIFTPNPEIVMYAQKNPRFKEIVNTAQINIPDGKGIVWAGKTLGYPIKERISGADLLEDMVLLALKNKAAIGLIGGFGNLALSSLECLKVKYPNLQGWAQAGPELKIKNEKLKINKESIIRGPRSTIYDPSSMIQLDYDNWNINDFIKRVKERNTKILFVGFGFPKQEFFIDQIASKLDNVVLMAVGGSFDFLSGKIERAPKWIRKAGLEWLYRLYKEPRRIRRQIVLPWFVVKILIHKILNPKFKAQMSKQIQSSND